MNISWSNTGIRSSRRNVKACFFRIAAHRLILPAYLQTNRQGEIEHQLHRFGRKSSHLRQDHLLEFPNLKVLQLSNHPPNQIRIALKIIQGISELHHLEQLNIGHYPLREGVFPEEICKLSKLTILNIQDINLEVLPSRCQLCPL
jgi:hypothetical protein